jgi:ferredoxin
MEPLPIEHYPLSPSKESVTPSKNWYYFTLISTHKSMSVNVLFLPDHITVPAQAGEPLLDVAARAGVSIATVCKVGACQSCRVKIAGQELPVRACLEKVSDASMSIVHILNN